MPIRHVSLTLLVLLVLAGCDSEKGSRERRLIVEKDQALVLRIFRDDLRRGVVGVERAAGLMSRGFLVEDAAQRERELRQVMRNVQKPPRAIEELMISPITFLAAVGTDGKVIARDAEPDLMRGFDMAEASPAVRQALEEGKSGWALTELKSTVEGDDRTSLTILFAAPARHEGRVVGAMISGLPLWSLSEQLSKQLRYENADAVRNGAIVWALVYRGDELHQHVGFPPDLLELVPGPEARAEGLSKSPGGYTGEVYQYGRWYGFGVLPLPRLGDDVGIIMFRSGPV